MKLIVGLGNPDKKYQNTRHNLGSKIVEQFAKVVCKSSFINKSKFSAQVAEYQNNLFVVPLEYMNNSGVSVQKIANFYKISPLDIYIVHDDLDIEIGDYRVQFDRGPAGHNGIKSIIENLATQQFNRIRIGIGKPQDSTSVEDYVLQNFSKEEQDIITTLTPEIFKEIKNILGPIV